MENVFDVVVIGAGMAGASVAAFLVGLGEDFHRLSQPALDSPFVQQESLPVPDPALRRFLGKLPMPLPDRGIAG